MISIGNNELELNCFFCGDKISAIKQKEEEICYSDRYEYKKTITLAIPVEKNLSVLKFKPKYIPLLNKAIENAETEVQQIFKSASRECRKALKPFIKKFGSNIGIELYQKKYDSTKYSPDRRQYARCIYGLSEYWYNYEIRGIDHIKPNYEDFIAHNNCIKKEITLEHFVNSPLIKSEFEDNFSEFTIPYRGIYKKLKSKKIKVIAKKFDFRKFLRGRNENKT